jgi:hypothetical protein
MNSNPQPLNFLRQVHDDLNWWAQAKAVEVPEYPKHLKAILKDAAHSVKFLMPDDGIIFDDGFKGVPDDFRLPFPLVALEFYGTEPDDYRSKNIVLAYQVKEAILVFHFHTFISKHKGEMWMLMPFFAECRPRIGVEEAKMDTEFLQEVLDAAKVDPKDAPAISQSSVRHFDIGGMAKHIYKDHWRISAYTGMSSAITAVFSLIEALSCSNVSSEALPVRKANKGALKRGALPFDEYRVLTLKPSQHGASSVDGDIPFAPGTGRSPREHLRRGHIRRLPSGKKIWVNAHVVNAGVQGKLHKTYALTAPVA